jgi:hypothetical protein
MATSVKSEMLRNVLNQLYAKRDHYEQQAISERQKEFGNYRADHEEDCNIAAIACQHAIDYILENAERE